MKTATSRHDFGNDLLPRLVARGERVYAYRFHDYWQDVGTLDSYYQSNLAFLTDPGPLRPWMTQPFAIVGRGALVDHGILDKDVIVGQGAQVGTGEGRVANRACPEHLWSGFVVVGKGAQLPPDLSVGRNARIGAFVPAEQFTDGVPAGGVVDGPESMH